MSAQVVVCRRKGRWHVTPTQFEEVASEMKEGLLEDPDVDDMVRSVAQHRGEML